MPLRLGFAASIVATRLGGEKAPSARPIIARMRISEPTPAARPLKPTSIEKPTIDTTSVCLRPKRSASRPARNAAMPHVMASAPVILPRSV